MPKSLENYLCTQTLKDKDHVTRLEIQQPEMWCRLCGLSKDIPQKPDFFPFFFSVLCQWFTLCEQLQVNVHFLTIPLEIQEKQTNQQTPSPTAGYVLGSKQVLRQCQG